MGRWAPTVSIGIISLIFTVVTGASDGIGKEFAIQLASAGFNVLLVARNSEMLNDVAAKIGSGFYFYFSTPVLHFL